MRHLRDSAILAFVIKVLAAGVSYAFVFSLVRTMTITDFGIISILMSASLLFSVVGAVGQQMAMIRFVPPFINRDDRSVMYELVGRSFRLAIVGSAIVFIILSSLVIGSTALGLVDNPGVWIFGLLLIPAVAIIDMQSYLARACRSVLLALLPKEVLWRLISGASIVMVFFATGHQPVVLSLSIGVLLAVIVGLTLVQGLLIRNRLGIPSSVESIFLRFATSIPSELAVWHAAKTPLWIASVSAIAFTNLDVIAIGLLLGADAAALYFAANRLSLLLSFFQMSYNIIIGPLFSEHHARGAHRHVLRIAQSATIQVFVPTLLMAVAMVVGAEPLLRLFGSEFVMAKKVLYILIFSGVLNAAFGPGDMLLMMCGQERVSMWISLWTMIAGISAIAVFGLVGGAEGVAMGVVVATVLRKGWFWLYAWRRLSLPSDVITAAWAKFSRLGE